MFWLRTLGGNMVQYRTDTAVLTTCLQFADLTAYASISLIDNILRNLVKGVIHNTVIKGHECACVISNQLGRCPVDVYFSIA